MREVYLIGYMAANGILRHLLMEKGARNDRKTSSSSDLDTTARPRVFDECVASSASAS
jgi:hypothetical protein